MGKNSKKNPPPRLVDVFTVQFLSGVFHIEVVWGFWEVGISDDQLGGSLVGCFMLGLKVLPSYDIGIFVIY